MDPRREENIPYFFFAREIVETSLVMIVRPASTFTISHPLALSFSLSISIYFSIPSHSPRSLVHDPRNKDPEDGRKGREERHRGEIIGDSGGTTGEFQRCLWKLHSIGSTSAKKDEPHVVAEKEICPIMTGR